MPSVPAWLSSANDYQDARVLVVGATGFIGYNLVRALVSAGASVTALSRGETRQRDPFPPGVEAHRVDITSADQLSGLVEGHDVIFDVAGRSGAVESNLSPLADLQMNLVGQFNLLEECRRRAPNARIIAASSRLVYGRPRSLPVDERHPTEPTSIYGIHRLTAEKYHLLYHAMHGLRITILRITVPYGPHQPTNTSSHGIVNLFMRAAVEGRPITLYGDGRQIRDILHIDDLVRVFLDVGQSKGAIGQVLNVGSGIPVHLADVAANIARIAGGEVEFTEWPGDAGAVETGDFYADISKIRNAIGWEPRVPLLDGLRSALGYYAERAREVVPS